MATVSDERKILLVCDHQGTPKRSRRERRLAIVKSFGLISEEIPILEIEYLGRYNKEEDEITRLDWPLERLLHEPELIHTTHTFRCRQCAECAKRPLVIKARKLYDVVEWAVSVGAPPLSLGQIAAMFPSKR